MAKDPAFLFYYDRFLSGTITMSDAEVGQYIRLMCIQANKGYISKKDMMHICKSYDNDVCLKFDNIGPDKFANSVLTEIVEQRKNYTESRRNNRKGKNKEDLSSTYVNHMVNKDVNVITIKKEDHFLSNADAHKWIMSNYLDVEKAKNILSNNGWRSVSDLDVGAVLFHFLESQVDLSTQSNSDVRSHFKRWINKQKIDDLMKLVITIKAKHERLTA